LVLFTGETFRHWLRFHLHAPTYSLYRTFSFSEKSKVKYSYANILAEYEQWIQNVSDVQAMITCNEQQVLMSQYQFETDKSPDAEQTLGDGGDLEEVWNTVTSRYQKSLITNCQL
jgi:hypothetical protein